MKPTNSLKGLNVTGVKKKHWIQMWKAEQPLFKHWLQVERYRRCRAIIGNTANEVLFTSANTAARMYLTEDSIRRTEKDGRKLLHPKVARANIRAIQKLAREFRICARCLRVFGEKATSLRTPAVVATFRTFDRCALRLFAYVSTTWEPTNRYPGERLRRLLQQAIPDADENAVTALMTPATPDLLLGEKRSWLAVVSDPSQQRLERHMLEFPYLFTNINSNEDSLRLMIRRLRMGRAPVMRKEIAETERKLHDRSIAQQRLLRRARQPEIRELASLIQQFTLLRLELKNCWAGIHYVLFPFYQKLAAEARQSIRDCMMLWSFDDILRYVEKGRVVPADSVAQRRKAYLLLLQGGRVTFAIGDKATRLQKRLLPPVKKMVRILRGAIANRGHVQGIVRVIDFDDLRVIEKTARGIKEKFVLVTGMTNPNTVPLIRKAKAIVTDEGGITCHAAIISREYNIPCIIATRTATRDLKTGDHVDIDANTGTVTLLTRRP